MKEILIKLNIQSEADTQAMLGLYAGILGSAKMYESQGSTILSEFCTQLENNLKAIFSPEQWTAIKAEITNTSQQAASYAEQNKQDFFSGLKIKG